MNYLRLTLGTYLVKEEVGIQESRVTGSGILLDSRYKDIVVFEKKKY